MAMAITLTILIFNGLTALFIELPYEKLKPDPVVKQLLLSSSKPRATFLK